MLIFVIKLASVLHIYNSESIKYIGLGRITEKCF
jgi:hypothetical protein